MAWGGAALKRLKHFLRKLRLDTVQPFAVRWIENNIPGEWSAGEPFQMFLRVRNEGSQSWPAGSGNAVILVVRCNGDIVSRHPLPHDVLPQGEITIGFSIELHDGRDQWELSLALTGPGEDAFAQSGAEPLVALITKSKDAPSRQSIIMRRHNFSSYVPSQWVPRSRRGIAYPTVIAEAVGARIRDPEGNEWVDYVMGWGACLLGYAHPIIRDAIASTIHSGAVLSLPHRLEADVTQQLVELTSAELVLFGKNGSDACTAAVRVARVTTGRNIVLFSGFHGWQDPFSAVFETQLRHGDATAFAFELNNRKSLLDLVAKHDGRVAAIMIEPAAQVEGVDGPVRDCDSDFLRAAADIARKQNAVLIFDEIMTGFRHSEGSVQKAAGVVPDLTCFGKGLSGGMPLSALVGRREIMQPALAKIFYHPTFKGEAYSFAAANAALAFYRDNDVPKQVSTFGSELMRQIDSISRELEINGQMVGLPYRMVYRFNEPDVSRRTHMRTLLQQELLQNGILTFRGFMLPSIAHGQAEMDATLSSFRKALRAVRDAVRADNFASKLEIPLIF